MTGWIESLVGEDWEQYAGVLLRYRHDPADVQAVPAVQGDLGIDYWIRGQGLVYQCYGTEYGVTFAEKLRLQKRKLSDEVRKIKKNHLPIADMIAPMLCRRYIFFVPEFDSKDLLKHAAAKTGEIRDADLAFCSEKFEIAVQALADFESERSSLRKSAFTTPRLVSDEPSVPQVHEWISDHGELATTIREKLKSIHPDSQASQLDQYVQHTVINYLAVEDALSNLEDEYPDLYEKARRVITDRRRRLRAIGGSSSQVGLQSLVQELDGLTQALHNPPVELDQSDAGIVATGTMAMWLADCTLDPR